MSVLELKNIDYYYEDGNKKRTILDDVSVEFNEGVFYTIIGESGSGKTTLLLLMASLDQPKEGKVLFKGTDIEEVGLLNYRRNNISIIFQDYNLIPYLNGVQNVQLAMDISSQNNSVEEALNILSSLGIDKVTALRKVSKISGGERQRIAIARALATKSEVIVADEPTGNLDNDTSTIIIEEFKRIAHELNKCVIVVTHSNEVANASDTTYSLNMKTHKLEQVK